MTNESIEDDVMPIEGEEDDAHEVNEDGDEAVDV